MANRTPEELQAEIDIIRNETVAGANTKTRVANTLQDIADSPKLSAIPDATTLVKGLATTAQISKLDALPPDAQSAQQVAIAAASAVSAAVPGTVTDLTVLATTNAPRGATVYVTGSGPWLAVDRATVNPNGVDQIAGVYAPVPLGWIRLDLVQSDQYALERKIIGRAALAANSFWLHPDQGLTSTGGAVTGWADCLSSALAGHNGHPGTDPVLPANRFVLGALANGCPAVVNNAGWTSHLLQGGVASVAGSHTFCAVMELASGKSNGALVAPNTGVGPETFIGGSSYGFLIAGLSHTAIVNALDCAGLQTICWVFDAVTDTCSLFLNDVKIGTVAYATDRDWSPKWIGSMIECFGGKLASVVYVSSADYTLVDIFHKWAVTRCGVQSWTTINLYDDIMVDSGDTVRCPFSELHVSTTASKIVLDWTCPTAVFNYPDQNEIALITNGVPEIVTATVAGNNSKYFAKNAGQKTLQVRDGTTIYSSHARVDKIHTNAAATIVTVAAPVNRLVIFGDSISVGPRTTNPTTEAWVMLVRSAFDGRVTSYGGGGWFLGGIAATPELIVDTVAILTQLLDGTVTNALWLAFGYNDAAGSASAELFQSRYSALLNAVIAAKPGIRIYAQSPIAATNEDPGTPLPDIRAATAAACVGKAGVTYVDGLSLGVPIGGDGIHPDTAGSIVYAAAVRAIIEA